MLVRHLCRYKLIIIYTTLEVGGQSKLGHLKVIKEQKTLQYLDMCQWSKGQ